MQDPKETYVAKSTQNKADNHPTNPSSGETARVGWRVASPNKRPSNPENQTVVVMKSFLGQGYKHPGHPAALSLDPYLRRLPAGDGKGGTGQGKGRQGPGGLQAGRPGFPKTYPTEKDARAQEMAEIPNPTTQNQRENQGDKTQQGEPHQPRGSKTPQNAKNREKIDKMSEEAPARARQADGGRCPACPCTARKAKSRRTLKKNKKQKKTHHLSSVSPPQPCRPKRKKVVVTAHPPGGAPKTPNQANHLTGTGT